jgi:hypothetical protein
VGKAGREIAIYGRVLCGVASLAEGQLGSLSKIAVMFALLLRAAILPKLRA